MNICAHLWESFLCKKVLCVPCVLREYLFSHGWHGWTQIVMVRCSPTEFTEYTEFGSVGMAGMPYPPNLCRSVPSVGVFSLPEVSVRSVHSVGGVAVVWCSRDAAPPGGVSVAFVGGSLSNRLPCLRRVLWNVNAHQICCEKLCTNPVTCNANIVQAPST